MSAARRRRGLHVNSRPFYAPIGIWLAIIGDVGRPINFQAGQFPTQNESSSLLWESSTRLRPSAPARSQHRMMVGADCSAISVLRSENCKEPEVFEIDLPITIFELSDDEFLEREDEKRTALNEDGCLRSQTKEDRRVGNEQEEQLSGNGFKGNNGEEQAMPIEVAKMKEDDEEIPITCENLNSVQVVLHQNALENADYDQKLVMGFLDHKTQNGTGNEHIKINQFASDHNYCQRIVVPFLNTQNKGGDHLADGVIQMVLSVAQETELVVNESVQESFPESACMHIGANAEGAAPLEIGFHETDNGFRKSGGLEDYTLLGHKLEEHQAENEKCVSTFINGDHPPGDAGSLTINDCANPEPDVAEHVQPSVADCYEEYDVQENLNDSSESTEDVQQLQEGLSSQKKYMCSQCSRVFYTHKHLQCHQKYHTRVQDSDKTFRNDCVKEQSKQNSCSQKTRALCSDNEKPINPSQSNNQLMPREEYDQEDGLQEEAHAQKKYCPSNLGCKMSDVFPNTYVCDHCNLVFCREELLIYHRGTHFQAQPSENMICKNQESGRNGKLRVVQPSCGPALKLFKCLQCAYTTSSFSNLRVHFSVHTGEKPFKCQECDKSFRNSSHLKRHSFSHLRKHYKCKQCLFIGTTVEDLKLHEETCKDEGPARKRCRLSASSCESSEKQSLAKGRGNKSALVFPESHVQVYRCEHCDYSTYILGRLKCHARMHTDERPYSCDVCQKSFRTSSHLKRHKFVHQNLELLNCDSWQLSVLASHTDKQPPRDGNRQKQLPSLPVKIYKCEECDYTTFRNGNLKIHLRIHTGEKPHKCSHCSLAFRTSSHLNRHLATHLQCKKCKFFATNKPALQKHAQTHKKKRHKEKGECEDNCNNNCTDCTSNKALNLFKCHQCAYSTNSFSNLRVHFTVHTGEKPFKCQECDKSF